MMRGVQLTIAFGLAALVAMTSFAQESEVHEPKVEMLSTQVLVVNSEGVPLEGATVSPVGLLSNDDPNSSYSWMTKEFGDSPEVLTGANGTVEVAYPRFVHERKRTTSVRWSIGHPEYAPFLQFLPIEAEPARAVLANGYRVAATAINGLNGEPIKEGLFGLVGNDFQAKWNLKNGVLISSVFSEGQSAMRIIHIPENGPALFSDLIDVASASNASRAFFKDVVLKPGIVVRGKLDESIPRPIKNGFVSALTVSRIDGANRNHLTDWDWWDKTEINEDGTFEFASVPGNGVLQMIPVCDGYASVDPDEELAKATFGENGNLSNGMTSAQFIRLDRAIVSPVLKMTQAATLHVLVVDQDNSPVPNCKIHLCPNQRWFESGTQILGEAHRTVDF